MKAIYVCVGILFFMLGGGIGNPGQSAQAATEVGAPADEPPFAETCVGITTIPEIECAALVNLYRTTDGEHWDNRGNWLTVNANLSPCDWYGVSCTGGHVTQLNLAGNRLRGLFPRGLHLFVQLTHLNLADNLLRGDVPPAVCDLTDTLVAASFDYNQLLVQNSTVRACLTRLDPDWAATQTTPPLHIRPVAITTTTVELRWTPIQYTGDGGYYEVSYATELNGPFTTHGRTADKRADGYQLDGLAPGQQYHIHVQTVTPAHAAQENEQRSASGNAAAVTEAPVAGKVLVLIYFSADNDLSSYVDSVVRRVQRGTSINPNIQVVLLADKRGDHNTVVLEIANGTIRPTRAVQERWGVDELNTADPQVLAWFLKAARSRYPTAARTVVSLMGHGAGLMPEFPWPATPVAAGGVPQQNVIPALPKGHDYTPGDVTDAGGHLSTLDYGRALAEATENGANPFDVIFFDQCFQGNLDVLYEVQRSAHVFVASPNYAWLVAPYEKYLTAFTPSSTPAEMGRAIIHIYQASLEDRDPNNDWYPNAIFWVRGADIAAIAGAVNALGSALQAALQGGAGERIWEAARQSQFVDTTNCGAGYLQLAPPDELLGAGSFARNLQRLFLADDGFGVSAAAGNVLTALAAVHSLARSGHPYIAPDELWNYEDTLTIVAPLQRDAPAGVVWRASIYTAAPPLTAIWSADPAQTVTIESSFSSMRDGAWDDFIGQWYTDPLTPTVGLWCSYMPPVQLTSEVTETLALSVAATSDLVQFAWSATSNETATDYWLLAKGTSFNWVVVETFPLTQTTYAVLPPSAGETYQFRVEARNEEGLIVALSANLQHATPDLERRVYLPFVDR